MLDLDYIRQNPDIVQESITRRRLGLDVADFLKYDAERRDLLQRVEELRRSRNTWSEQIPKLSNEEKPKAIDEVRTIKSVLAELEPKLETVETAFKRFHRDIPNILSPDVPFGKDDTENTELRVWGKKPDFDFTPKDHLELGIALDLLDFEKATLVTGSKFYFLKNEAVLLQLALQQYALDLLLKEGFSPIYSPVLAKNEILDGAGFNPRGEEKQIYVVEEEDLSLIATSEITLNGYFANTVLEEKDLPIKMVGISECYRREAGSWGRFSKGLYRVHHFLKVEMFIFCKPDQSGEMHEYLLGLEEKIYQGLEIPYRVVNICDGDLGAVAYKKYDLEAWMPGRDGGSWGEITSCSNCTDYQARRLNIKFKDAGGNKQLVHTLNGTAIAMSRTPIAIFENFQQADGSIKIPPVLQQYMGGRTVITSKN
ncbi:MAG: serine--tRNA ligase [bacterium]